MLYPLNFDHLVTLALRLPLEGLFCIKKGRHIYDAGDLLVSCID